MDFTVQLLRDLTNANGTSGHEEAIAEVMAGYMKDLAEIEYDKLGSIIGTKRGTADRPRVLIDAHMDEVGFMVREITKEGFIKFLPLGGWWGHVTLGQRMRVMGKKGVVIGVIGTKPPHLLKDEERKVVMNIEDMFIDVGSYGKTDITKKFGIEVGDAVVPDSDFTVMADKDVYLAKAFDNRMSCAIVIELLKKLQSAKHPNTVIGAGSVLEEVGLRGAATVAHVVEPDVAIIIDVGMALDIPGYDGRVEKFGGGPSILIYESGMIPNTRLRQLFMDTARKIKIPFNLSYMERGSSDGARIHITRSGVPSLYIGPPTRYVHSHNSMIYRKDYDHTVRLIFEVIRRMDKKTVNSLTAR